LTSGTTASIGRICAVLSNSSAMMCAKTSGGHSGVRPKRLAVKHRFRGPRERPQRAIRARNQKALNELRMAAA
jgi:hypothetical protein